VRALIRLVGGRLRLWVDLAILAAIVVVVVAVLSSGSRDANRAPSAAEVRGATVWLRHLRLPAVAIPDASDTACLIPVQLCVTSRASDRQLLAALRAAFASHAGGPGTVDCTTGIGASCVFFARYRGARIAVTIQPIRGYLDRSSVARAVIQNVNPAPVLPEPLPSLGSLRAVPLAVGVHLRCMRHLSSGCEMYSGRFALHGAAATLTRSWFANLQGTGWLIFPFPCVAFSGGERCRVAATRSVEPRGARFVLINAVLADSGHGTLRGIVGISAV
jgi:hypothetical protein